METRGRFVKASAFMNTPCWNGSRSYVRRNGVSDAWWECVNSGVRNGFLGNPVDRFTEAKRSFAGVILGTNVCEWVLGLVFLFNLLNKSTKPRLFFCVFACKYAKGQSDNRRASVLGCSSTSESGFSRR